MQKLRGQLFQGPKDLGSGENWLELGIFFCQKYLDDEKQLWLVTIIFGGYRSIPCFLTVYKQIIWPLPDGEHDPKISGFENMTFQATVLIPDWHKEALKADRQQSWPRPPHFGG
jgi:hypothetical protein